MKAPPSSIRIARSGRSSRAHGFGMMWETEIRRA
jgi:hypothetical protein